MDRFPRFAAGLAAACALVCIPLAAQNPGKASDGFRQGKPILQADPPMPFPSGRETSAAGPAVQFRTPDQMSAADRELEADSESTIAEHAGIANLEFNHGEWTYRQIVCSALPNHLLLRFMRNNGPRDQSVFTASIPRNGQGRIRIIPIVRRGYSLWSPAPINAITIAQFNQIRREEGDSTNADWLQTGMCYAAMAGANPVVGPLNGSSALSQPAPPMAEMEVPLKGGAIVRFTDETSRPRPTLWTLTFNPSGRLLKVKHQPAATLALRQVPSAHSPNAVVLPTPSENPVTTHPIELKTPPPPPPASN